MKKQLNIKKLILLNLPYILMGLFSTNFGEAWRMAVGADASAKMLSFFSTLPVALASWWPSLHPLDLLVGLCCCGGLRLAVYLKSKNAKKYRHGMEYGSARWGTHEDITPYIDPVFQNNVILTKTESLTMNSRPKDPKTARNKNVLVIGGSGSGKTRFWLKPNLMQMHSSYVVTDPKGTILVEFGKMLQRGAPKLGKHGKPMKDKHGKVIYEPYRIKVLNTINFRKSMHYNPFAYIHSEKDMGNKPLLFGGGSPDMSNSEDLTGVQFVNGTRPGNPQLVELAKRQVGNVGGYPYWSWYGFDSRVSGAPALYPGVITRLEKVNRALQAVSGRAFRGSSLMDNGVQEAITIWLPEMQFSLIGIWMEQQTMWVS